MSGREVFRVQGPDGRGPWRPGLTGLWADPELWADFPPVQIAFGERIFDTIKLRIALLGGGAGCACASPEILCRWFSPTERLRLAKLKFRPVRLLVDRVLAESPDQLVFWRRKPPHRARRRDPLGCACQQGRRRMTMLAVRAYYNEIDPFAAAWLRELIKAGQIAPGDVDERSIEDVCPNDLVGYSQCHFFAGIGVWSHALRRSGWADDRPVWTGSCPCQPFSAAGKGGGFADERHLWPAFFHLIGECRPRVVFGEQVASKDGLGWLDLVSADLEGAGYACGAVDTCAAGFGAPHIRQRLYWCAERMADSDGRDSRSAREREAVLGAGRRGEGRAVEQRGGASGRLAHATFCGCGEKRADARRLAVRDRTEGLTPGSGTSCGDFWAGSVNGLWRDADWLFCRDGKWRPVEPGTFPLAHGAPARVGRLRGYGNAINAEQAQGFIEAYLEARVYRDINVATERMLKIGSAAE